MSCHPRHHVRADPRVERPIPATDDIHEPAWGHSPARHGVPPTYHIDDANVTNEPRGRRPRGRKRREEDAKLTEYAPAPSLTSRRWLGSLRRSVGCAIVHPWRGGGSGRSDRRHRGPAGGIGPVEP